MGRLTGDRVARLNSSAPLRLGRRADRVRDLLEDAVGRVTAPQGDRVAVRAHLDALTKPPGSLGRLEELALQVGVVLGDPPPPLERARIVVFAADHGVAARGVSAYPAEVTAQMCANLSSGGAAINVLARACGAEVRVVDVGVAADLSGIEGIGHRKIRWGTDDLTVRPAMTEVEVVAALEVGVGEECARPAPLIGVGEMGIGNTTAAAAVTAALTGARPCDVVGGGTGVDRVGLARKRAVVEKAVARLGNCTDPLEALRQVGGLEIAAMAGAMIGAAARGALVLVDGFISTAAALAACRFCPTLPPYLIASHRSTEPGHAVALDALELRPLLELEMRLGEGTGCALAIPLVRAAAALLREMATFESAGISGPAAGAAPSPGSRP